MTTKQAKFIETVSVTTYQKRTKPRKHYVGSAVCISSCSFFYWTGPGACTLISFCMFPTNPTRPDFYLHPQVFQIQVSWTGGKEFYIFRSYNEFYSFHVSTHVTIDVHDNSTIGSST